MVLCLVRPEKGAKYRSSVASAALRGLAEDVADLQRQLCESHDLEPLDYLILRALGDMPGAGGDKLASYAHASKTDLAAAIGRLNGVGLARLRGGPDRLTDAGRLVVTSIESSIENAMETALDGLALMERLRLALVVEVCRSAVWEAASTPVVAILEPVQGVRQRPIQRPRPG